MDLKRLIIGGAATLIIGGSGYAVSQSDIMDNFREETGMSQEESDQFVDSISDNQASFDEIGKGLVSESEEFRSATDSADCMQYEYEWETTSLSCAQGVQQMKELGRATLELGNCYVDLGMDLGSKEKSDSKIRKCIGSIDKLIAAYELPIVTSVVSADEVEESKKIHLYNKSILRAALM